MRFLKEALIKEFVFKASRSGGSGGQHVNKVSSKVELYWKPQESLLFSKEEKEPLIQKLSGRINKDGVLRIVSEEDRSQNNNRQHAIEKAIQLIQKGLFVPKKRKATKPSKSSVEKRLDSKRQQSLKKINRNFKID